MNFFTSNTSMCDSSGNLLFYSNGEKIYHAGHQLMPNGNNLAPSNLAGIRAPQAVLALPYPMQPKKYILLNTDYITHSGEVIGWKFFDNTIDMASPNGQVVKKLNLLVNDSIAYGKLTATKHANGRDWWFLVPKALYSNVNYIGTLSPQGIGLRTQEIGSIVHEGLGQAVFSPDGAKYIKANSIDASTLPRVDIYDFDRCSGQLSNQRTLLIDHEGFGIGVSVSPDSRYLYVTRTRIAYQYDLTVPDIAATQTVIAKWNGFVSYNGNNVFWLSQLAPDGRIYVGSLNNTYHLHQINFPNREDTACQFLQHSLKLPVLHLYDIPNHPNYRLGPLDGSPCDTLGLDNHPLANFRWEHEDSTELLRVTFTDLSAYEPESWQWDFGDGTTSMERYPVHDYPQEGVYNACLIVKNRFSSDTFCQKVYLGVSAQDNPDLQSRIEVWPNPFSDRLVLALSTPDLGRPLFRLFDATGRLVREERVEYGLNEIEVGDLAKGLYFWAVEQKGERIKSGKVVKM